MVSEKLKGSMSLVSEYIFKILLIIGTTVLALMMFFTVFDVVGRYVFNMPVEGGFELIEFMMAIFIPFALLYCEQHKSHITVDLLYDKFPKLLQRILAGITSALTVLYFSLICWQSYLAIIDELTNKITSSVLMIPTYPFFIPLVIAFGGLVVVFIQNFFESSIASERG